jgi:hypothetical protein
MYRCSLGLHRNRLAFIGSGRLRGFPFALPVQAQGWQGIERAGQVEQLRVCVGVHGQVDGRMAQDFLRRARCHPGPGQV